MTDRLDRIEMLLETLAVRQEATQTQLDNLVTSQQGTQNQLDSLAVSFAQLGTRQTITQNQIDSVYALANDNRQAIAVLLQASVRHEGRLDDLEGQGEAE